MELVVKKRFNYLPVGFAIFSMFFGAGNSIFPLLIGSNAGDKNIYAVMGFIISTILVPMLGLVAMSFYKGDYKEFFYRLGKVPGFAIILLIMVIIGPFAGIPRCITLSYATLKPHLGATSLATFSSIASLLIFAKTIKRTKLIDILGKFLTPLLLVCLAIIIIKGINAPAHIAPALYGDSPTQVFFSGLTKGFQMMDLLASFFFSATVLTCLKAKIDESEVGYDQIVKNTFLKSIVVAAALLGVIYVGFSYVAANNSVYFQTISPDNLLGAVSQQILGKHLSLVMGVAVALACLTTAITLVSVFSDFIYNECFGQKIPYYACIIGTVIVAFFFSNLGFSGICNMIAPILFVCYPALIALTILNIAHKVFKFEPIKWPVYAVLALSLLINLKF